MRTCLCCFAFFGLGTSVWGQDLVKAKEFFENMLFDSSIFYLNKHLIAEPESIDALKIKASIYRDLGNNDSALIVLQKIVAIEQTDNPHLYNAYGSLLYKNYLFDSAQYYFNKAYLLDSTIADLNYNISVLYHVHDKDNNRALLHINNEIAMHGASINNLLLKSSIHLDLKNYAEVLKITDTIIQMNKHEAEAHNYQGMAYSQTGNNLKAISSYTKAINIDSFNKEYFVGRASIYASMQNYNNAIDDYKVAIKLDNKCVDAYVGLVYVYEKLHEMERVCFFLSLIENLNPSDSILKKKKSYNCK